MAFKSVLHSTGVLSFLCMSFFEFGIWVLLFFLKSI